MAAYFIGLKLQNRSQEPVQAVYRGEDISHTQATSRGAHRKRPRKAGFRIIRFSYKPFAMLRLTYVDACFAEQAEVLSSKSHGILMSGHHVSKAS